MKLFGIDLAPLNTPLERRLQTSGVLFFVFLFLQGASLVGLTTLITLLFTRYYWLTPIYVIWYISDFQTCHKGGRFSRWCRNWPIWHYYAKYFPLKLIKTVDLSSKENYIFCVHPHGVMSVSAFGNFSTEGTGFSQMFPGLTPHLLVLKEQFMGPIMRELCLLTGMGAASRNNMKYVLTNKGRWSEKGQVCALIIGGAAESLKSHPGTYRLILKNRKGFIRTALQFGTNLVPVFSFGETDTFNTYEVLKGSRVEKLQKTFKRFSNFGLPIFWARGIFNYSFGLLPHRTSIYTVVGKPIVVEKNVDPSSEDIDALHKVYMKELVKLFEENKVKYATDKNVKLEIE